MDNSVLKITTELRANSEAEAQQYIADARRKASEEGYVIGAASYVYKTKKAKGEVIDEGYQVKILKVFRNFWD